MCYSKSEILINTTFPKPLISSISKQEYVTRGQLCALPQFITMVKPTMAHYSTNLEIPLLQYQLSGN